MSTGLEPPWPDWDHAHTDLTAILPPPTLAVLDDTAEFAARWSSTNDHRRALRTVQVLVHVGLTSPDVLTAGLLLDSVRTGDAPLPAVREHCGSRPAKLLIHLLPRTRQADPRALLDISQLLAAPAGSQAVALADWYTTAEADPSPDHAAQARTLLLIARNNPPFDWLLADWLTHALGRAAPTPTRSRTRP